MSPRRTKGGSRSRGPYIVFGGAAKSVQRKLERKVAGDIRKLERALNNARALLALIRG